MVISKDSIQHYSEIIDDFLLDPDTLGDLQGIVCGYNRKFTIENLNQAILILLEDILRTGYVAIDKIYDKSSEVFIKSTLKNTPEIITFVRNMWKDMDLEDPLWYYIIFFKSIMPFSEYKSLLAKAAKNNWCIVSPGVEKLEHTNNRGLNFLFKKKGPEGKPIIETFKNGKYISTQTFEE